MSIKDFQKGVEAASRPFEHKFEEQRKESEGLKNKVDKHLKEFSNVQDDIIDIVEEHDARIGGVEKQINISEDKEKLLRIGNKYHKVLLGLLLKLQEKESFNENQVYFLDNLREYLDTDASEEVSFEILEDIEDINCQRIMLQVMFECSFLKNNTLDSMNTYEAEFEYFSVSKTIREKLKKKVMDIYNIVGIDGIVNKYTVSLGTTIRREQKKFPKLEIDLDFNCYVEEPEVFLEMDEMLLFENIGDDYVCRSRKECENRVKEIVNKYYIKAERYLSEYDSLFIGRNIAIEYAQDVLEKVDRVKTYITVNKLRFNLESLEKLNANSIEKDILEMCKREIKIKSWYYKLLSLSDFVSVATIDEDETYVETLFGGMKLVKCYGCIDFADAVLKIDEDLHNLIKGLIEAIEIEIKNKYIHQIENICNEIKKSYLGA